MDIDFCSHCTSPHPMPCLLCLLKPSPCSSHDWSGSVTHVNVILPFSNTCCPISPFSDTRCPIPPFSNTCCPMAPFSDTCCPIHPISDTYTFSHPSLYLRFTPLPLPCSPKLGTSPPTNPCCSTCPHHHLLELVPFFVLLAVLPVICCGIFPSQCLDRIVHLILL